MPRLRLPPARPLARGPKSQIQALLGEIVPKPNGIIVTFIVASSDTSPSLTLVFVLEQDLEDKGSIEYCTCLGEPGLV